jgi:hypothetical protein
MLRSCQQALIGLQQEQVDDDSGYELIREDEESEQISDSGELVTEDDDEF